MTKILLIKIELTVNSLGDLNRNELTCLCSKHRRTWEPMILGANSSLVISLVVEKHGTCTESVMIS
jgi:hypothetical protein